MSRQFRHRMAAIVLGGFFLGGPLVASGTANAGLSVATEQTGTAAPTTGPMTRSAPRPEPTGVPSRPVPITEPGLVGAPKTMSMSPPPSGSVPGRPRARPKSTSRSSAAGRSRAKHSRVRPATPGRPVKSVRKAQVKAHRPQTKIKVKTPAGTAGSLLGGRAGGTGVPGLGGVSGLDLTPMGAGAVSRSSAGEPVMAEPMAARRRLPVEGRVGLLAAVAAVCAIGVTTAAIRSIVS